jgi:hypothetical protein
MPSLRTVGWAKALLASATRAHTQTSLRSLRKLDCVASRRAHAETQSARDFCAPYTPLQTHNYPRPTNGIRFAITVINSTFVSSGSLAM